MNQIKKNHRLRPSGTDLVTPDGIGIVIASRRKSEPISERVTGFDLLLRLLEKGSRYPNVVVAGRHNGFFSEEEEPYILKEIQQSKPNILIIAMGAPYSDKWIYKHKHKLDGVKVVFWKKLNLEWLHRLLFHESNILLMLTCSHLLSY